MRAKVELDYQFEGNFLFVRESRIELKSDLPMENLLPPGMNLFYLDAGSRALQRPYREP